MTSRRGLVYPPLLLNTLGAIAALFLSLAGYSAGAVIARGGSEPRKPFVFDLVAVVVLWSGVLVGRTALDVSRWLWLPIGLGSGFALGFLLSAVFPGTKRMSVPEAEKAGTGGPAKKTKTGIWREISLRIGTFQSLVVLGLLFLTVFAPFALAVCFFSDPLKLKKPGRASHWSAKKPIGGDLELFKRQS